MKKKKKSIILGVSLFFVTIGVSAATILYSANNVTYSSSTLSGNNVKDALDNLITKCQSSATTCPSGMTCTDKTNIKCKRATTLHTETCRNTSTSVYCQAAGYSSGATITYGNQTITEGVLTTGDAFDCDVNGDGTFDASTERFYYVSSYYDTNTKSFNDKYAVLIYYSNVRGGVANTAGTAYATKSDAQTVGTCTSSLSCNWYGPVTARQQLPTTSQWSNIRLYKEERQILGPNNATATSGGTLPTAFSYAGYSARLLTHQEIHNGCYSYDKYPNSDGGLDAKCQFLMEGTKFSNSSLQTSGSWDETPYDLDAQYASIVITSSRSSSRIAVNSTFYGVRPTIEILKSEILY